MPESADDFERFRNLNDWPLRRFLLIGVALTAILISYAVMREALPSEGRMVFLGYLLVPFLIVVPGAAILRVLRVHDLGFTKSFLISVALGIGALFVLTCLLNSAYYLGIYGTPLTMWPIIGGYSVMTIALMALVRMRDSEYAPEPREISVDWITILTWSLAAFLPFMAILGANVAGYDGDRDILEILLLVVCASPLALLSHRVRRYELFILSVSLTLLLHRSLLTNYLMGYDIFSEFTGASYVIANGFWNYAESSAILVGAGANTSLAVVAFIPMVYHLTGIDIIMIFKLVYPLIYGIVPLALYHIIKGQFDERAAAVGAFVFMAFAEYYGLMIQLAKQEMAELFLVVLLLVMFERGLTRSSRRYLALASLLGVMVSHYAIAFLTLGVFGLMTIFTLALNMVDGWRSTNGNGALRRLLFPWQGIVIFAKEQWKEKIVTLDLLIASGAFFLVWYTYTASGVMLSFFQRGSSAVANAGSSTLLPGQYNLQGMDMLEYILIDQGSILHNTPKIMFVLVQLLCIFGVIYALWNLYGARNGATREFVALGMVGGVLILMGYTVPYFSSMFYYGRLFHYTLIFLSGFLLIGIFGIAMSAIDVMPLKGDTRKKCLRLVRRSGYVVGIGIVTVIIFTNSSALYSLAGNYNTSFAVDDSVSWSIYADSDVTAAKWATVAEHRGNESVVADWHRFPIFGGLHVPNKNLLYSFDENDTDALIFISQWNTKYHYIYPLNVAATASLTYTDISNVTDQINGTYGIPYSAGKSSYYYIPPSIPDSNPMGPSIYQYEDVGLDVLYALIAIFTTLLALAILLPVIRRRRADREELDLWMDDQ